jgi:hypothetical protein
MRHELNLQSIVYIVSVVTMQYLVAAVSSQGLLGVFTSHKSAAALLRQTQDAKKINYTNFVFPRTKTGSSTDAWVLKYRSGNGIAFVTNCQESAEKHYTFLSRADIVSECENINDKYLRVCMDEVLQVHIDSQPEADSKNHEDKELRSSSSNCMEPQEPQESQESQESQELKSMSREEWAPSLSALVFYPINTGSCTDTQETEGNIAEDTKPFEKENKQVPARKSRVVVLNGRDFMGVFDTKAQALNVCREDLTNAGDASIKYMWANITHFEHEQEHEQEHAQEHAQAHAQAHAQEHAHEQEHAQEHAHEQEHEQEHEQAHEQEHEQEHTHEQEHEQNTQADTVWILPHYESQSVLYVAESQKAAQTAHNALVRVGLSPDDDIKYWEYEVGQISISARRNINNEKRVDNCDATNKFMQSISFEKITDEIEEERTNILKTMCDRT